MDRLRLQWMQLMRLGGNVDSSKSERSEKICLLIKRRFRTGFAAQSLHECELEEVHGVGQSMQRPVDASYQIAGWRQFCGLSRDFTRTRIH